MDKPIEWSIKGIKELEFVVNESIKADLLDTNYRVAIDPQVEIEELRITISFSFHKSETHEVIMKSSVMTVFFNKGFKVFFFKSKWR